MPRRPVSKPVSSTSIFEKALSESPDEERYVLQLFVSGMTLRSSEALVNIKTICEEHLHGRYELEVIDIYQHPELARDEQIIAAPTLIKRLPEPLRRFIGNLSDEERVLMGLDLRRIPPGRPTTRNRERGRRRE